MTNKVIFNMGQGEPAVTGRIPEEWLREAKCWAGHDVEVVVSDAGVLEQFRINLAKGAGVEEGGRLVKLAMRITGAIEPIQRAMDVFSQENSRFTLLRGGLGGVLLAKEFGVLKLADVPAIEIEQRKIVCSNYAADTIRRVAEAVLMNDHRQFYEHVVDLCNRHNTTSIALELKESGDISVYGLLEDSIPVGFVWNRTLQDTAGWLPSCDVVTIDLKDEVDLSSTIRHLGLESEEERRLEKAVQHRRAKGAFGEVTIMREGKKGILSWTK